MSTKKLRKEYSYRGVDFTIVVDTSRNGTLDLHTYGSFLRSYKYTNKIRMKIEK